MRYPEFASTDDMIEYAAERAHEAARALAPRRIFAAKPWASLGENDRARHREAARAALCVGEDARRCQDFKKRSDRLKAQRDAALDQKP